MKMLTQSNKVTAIVMPTGLDVPPVLWITGSLGQATKLVSFHRSFKMRNGWTRSLGWLCAAALLIYDSLLLYPEKGSKQRVPPLQVRRYIGPELSWIPIVVDLFWDSRPPLYKLSENRPDHIHPLRTPSPGCANGWLGTVFGSLSVSAIQGYGLWSSQPLWVQTDKWMGPKGVKSKSNQIRFCHFGQARLHKLIRRADESSN